ncbi:leucine-rich repeat extensin-like protein 5 [Nilaparvata lugens]|uniref:Cuticular protein n=1 Tax=Nilaparvata lugens TaxID=108931 RepID=A0A2S1ZS92_NILLU|nr:leucine-rich repeat extensin-like protein 5 [Nilaparvata lugens]AWK28326.1 cuticular protein [Nilaparvata lugens]
MRSIICVLLLSTGVLAATDGRRVRVRPVSSTEDQDNRGRQVEYYAEQSDEENAPVLVSRQDTYGRATGAARAVPGGAPRLRPETRQPPVQTIRNYNKLNDDGSFTFGYEAADGSFKEETRGTDCVVRGKYGYVDPDGNKREFTYVSGNPCDPNAVEQEEEERPSSESGEENVPQNYPRRPIKPASLRPVSAPKPLRPATTVFQNTYNTGSYEDGRNSAEDEGESDDDDSRPQAPLPVRPLYRPVSSSLQPSIIRGAATPKASTFVSTTPAPRQPVRITPRPATAELPATTYRPQLLASPTPTPVYSKRPSGPTTPGSLNFDEELKKFQIDNNVVSTPRTPTGKTLSTDPIYQSELVFDPASGQYNTVLYQQLPQTQGDFNLRHRLQPYVHNPAPNPFFPPARPFPAPERTVPSPVYQQQLFQQQQAALLQQSQQLFADQQKRKQQQKPSSEEDPRSFQTQRFPPSLLRQEPQQFQPQSQRFATPKPEATQRFPPGGFSPSPIQSFYYVSPQPNQANLASGQIDSFLRGHSLAI